MGRHRSMLTVVGSLRAKHDRGVRWNDPAIGVEWPLGGSTPLLSAQDEAQPLLADAPLLPQYASAR